MAAPEGGRQQGMGPRPIPNVDFSKIPPEYEGYWVVVRLGDESHVLAQADSPQEAVRMSRVDMSDPSYVLTQVPEVPTAARMANPDES